MIHIHKWGIWENIVGMENGVLVVFWQERGCETCGKFEKREPK